MSPAEDAYGLFKRLQFCEEIITSLRPAFVLDVGCGTGEQLTRPLAERFPEIRFLGIDGDADTIRYARSGVALPNLSFGSEEDLTRIQGAELIVASEVLEHVEAPERLLASVGDALAAGGRVIVTLPNGYGPFELASLIEALLGGGGVLTMLRRLKRRLVGGGAEVHVRDTLARSPHISFFSYREVLDVFASAGFEVERYRARTLLCGFGFDIVVRRFALGRWNARAADSLPPPCVSAWMFLLRKSAPQAKSPYRRGVISRWRRRLNERLMNAGGPSQARR